MMVEKLMAICHGCGKQIKETDVWVCDVKSRKEYCFPCYYISKKYISSPADFIS